MIRNYPASHGKIVVQFCVACAILLHGACNFATAGSFEEAQRTAAKISAARQQLELAEHRVRLFERVEQPLRLNKIESEIQFVAAEVASFERREREYAQFNKWKYSSPLFSTIEQTHLSLLAAQLRLQHLQEQRLLMLRYASDERRALQLAVEEAQQQLRSAAAGK